MLQEMSSGPLRVCYVGVEGLIWKSGEGGVDLLICPGHVANSAVH